MSMTIAGARALDQAASILPNSRPWTVPLSAGVALFALDVILLAALWVPTFAVVSASVPIGWPGLAAAVLYPLGIIAFHYAAGLYRRDASGSLRCGLGRLPVSIVMSIGSVSAALLLFAPVSVEPGLLAGGCAMLAGLLARLGFDASRRRGLFSRSVLVLGAGKRAWELTHLLRTQGRTLSYDMHFLHDPALDQVDPQLAGGEAGPVLTVDYSNVSVIVDFMRPDEIVVAPDERRGMELYDLLDCKIAGFPVSDYHGFVERELRRVDMKRIELSWLIYSDGFTMNLIDRALKRALDIFVSALVLIPLSPFLLAAIVVIRLQDGGPALYRQTRITQRGRPFQVLKLRTMRVDAERGGAAWAAQGDARVTRFGAFLRRVRLDEVPQLMNILRGEMSFVGPRPERPEFVEMLAAEMPLYNTRHATKAGLTGWAQVNYPYGASVDDARSKLSYDLYYIKNFSLLFDVLIILQTLRAVVWPTGQR